MSTNIQPHSISTTRGAAFPNLLAVPPFALPVARAKSSPPSTPNPNNDRQWVKISSGNGAPAKNPASDQNGALRDSGVSTPPRPSYSITSSSGSKSRTSSSGSSTYSAAPRPAFTGKPAPADGIEEDWEVVYPDE